MTSNKECEANMAKKKRAQKEAAAFHVQEELNEQMARMNIDEEEERIKAEMAIIAEETDL